MMDRGKFAAGRRNKLYWSQFHASITTDSPTVDYFKFLFLVVLSIYIQFQVDDQFIRDLFMIVGACAVIIIVIILLFHRKKIY